MDDKDSPATSEPEDDQTSSLTQFWRQLPDERFDLLRLAPQPSDQETGPRPLRFVQLGRLERHSREQSLLRLTLQLPEQKLRKEQNYLELWLDHHNQEAHFGPPSGLSLEPQNRGLGRFLLAQAALWSRQYGALYRLTNIPLSGQKPFSARARTFLEHYLKIQKLTSEADKKQFKKHCAAVQLSDLNSDWNHEKVQFVGQLESALLLQQADYKQDELDMQLRKQHEHLAQLKYEKNGLHFTVACLWIFSLCMAGLLIWIALH